MIFFAKRSILDVWQGSEYFCLVNCSTKLRPSFKQASPMQKVVTLTFVRVCLQIPRFPSYLPFKNTILAFTCLLAFWRWDSVKYALASAIFHSHDFCVTSWVRWVVHISQFQAMKLKLLLLEKGCQTGRDGIMEKRNKYLNFT